MEIVFEWIWMILLVSMAVVWDFRTWRVPNWIVLLVMETGVWFSVRQNGLREGVLFSAVGILIPVICLFFLFAVGWLGAGDIKLFAAIGAFAGKQIGQIMLYAFLAGGVLAVLYVGVYLVIPLFRKHGGQPNAELIDDAGHGKHRIHFSLAILLGCLAYWRLG